MRPTRCILPIVDMPVLIFLSGWSGLRLQSTVHGSLVLGERCSRSFRVFCAISSRVYSLLRVAREMGFRWGMTRDVVVSNMGGSGVRSASSGRRRFGRRDGGRSHRLSYIIIKNVSVRRTDAIPPANDGERTLERLCNGGKYRRCGCVDA